MFGGRSSAAVVTGEGDPVEEKGRSAVSSDGDSLLESGRSGHLIGCAVAVVGESND